MVTRAHRAWAWLQYVAHLIAGLRFIQADTRQELEYLANRSLPMARLKATEAERHKRDAQRILAVISEPLKDWDLADFPPIAGSQVNQLPTTLSYEHAQHLSRVIQGYQAVSREAAQARMSVTFNDKVRVEGGAPVDDFVVKGLNDLLETWRACPACHWGREAEAPGARTTWKLRAALIPHSAGCPLR